MMVVTVEPPEKIALVAKSLILNYDEYNICCYENAFKTKKQTPMTKIADIK